MALYCVNVSEYFCNSFRKYETDRRRELEERLGRVNGDWKRTVSAAREQNAKLRDSMARSTTLEEGLADLSSFLEHLSGDIPSSDEPVRQPSELSQRTYKLLQLRDRTERKRPVLERVAAAADGLKEEAAAAQKVSALKERWAEVTGPLEDMHDAMKEVGNLLAKHSCFPCNYVLCSGYCI